MASSQPSTTAQCLVNPNQLPEHVEDNLNTSADTSKQDATLDSLQYSDSESEPNSLFNTFAPSHVPGKSYEQKNKESSKSLEMTASSICGSITAKVTASDSSLSSFEFINIEDEAAKSIESNSFRNTLHQMKISATEDTINVQESTSTSNATDKSDISNDKSETSNDKSDNTEPDLCTQNSEETERKHTEDSITLRKCITDVNTAVAYDPDSEIRTESFVVIEDDDANEGDVEDNNSSGISGESSSMNQDVVNRLSILPVVSKDTSFYVESLTKDEKMDSGTNHELGQPTENDDINILTEENDDAMQYSYSDDADCIVVETPDSGLRKSLEHDNGNTMTTEKSIDNSTLTGADFEKVKINTEEMTAIGDSLPVDKSITHVYRSISSTDTVNVKEHDTLMSTNIDKDVSVDSVLKSDPNIIDQDVNYSVNIDKDIDDDSIVRSKPISRDEESESQSFVNVTVSDDVKTKDKQPISIDVNLSLATGGASYKNANSQERSIMETDNTEQELEDFGETFIRKASTPVDDAATCMGQIDQKPIEEALIKSTDKSFPQAEDGIIDISPRSPGSDVGGGNVGVDVGGVATEDGDVEGGAAGSTHTPEHTFSKSDSFAVTAGARGHESPRQRRNTDTTIPEHGDDVDDEESFEVVPVDNGPIRGGREDFEEFKRQVENWNDLDIGGMIYFKYFGLWHAALVTAVFPKKKMLKAIHYAWPGTGLSKLVTPRMVMEETFKPNIENGDLWEVMIPPAKRYEAFEAIDRACARLGETKFNLFTRRSNHFVRECILRDF